MLSTTLTTTTATTTTAPSPGPRGLPLRRLLFSKRLLFLIGLLLSIRQVLPRQPSRGMP